MRYVQREHFLGFLLVMFLELSGIVDGIAEISSGAFGKKYCYLVKAMHQENQKKLKPT
jgi:hypothetical protein